MKKAILVVSFGTTHEDALKNSIEKIENMIKEEFKGYDVYRAFTSHMIINKIKKRDNICIHNPSEALEDLLARGYEEVLVQPLHIIAGEEFDYINGMGNLYKEKFKKIRVGRPILCYQGNGEVPKDYSQFIKTIKDEFKGEESIVLFGHGTAHPSNAAYGMLQTVLFDEGYENVFVATVEGYPNVDSMLNRLKKQNIKKTKLMPLFTVCGDHAKNDMAGSEDDSLKSRLESEGIEVSLHMNGLGQNEKFDALYIRRIYDLIEDRYINLGKTKKL